MAGGLPPDRAAGLADLDLGPAPAPAPTPIVEPQVMPVAPVLAPTLEPEPEPEPEAPASTAPEQESGSAARPEKRRKAPKETENLDEGAIVKKSPRIPASMFAQVNEERVASGDTHEQWFLTAFDAVWDELDEHYKRAQSSRVPIPQRRARRPGEDPLVNYPLRLTTEAEKVLDERQKELRPVSLSEFVTTIVRLRLAQLKREQGEPQAAG